MSEKPLSIVQKETFDNLVEVINNSKLHPLIIVPMLSELLNEAKLAMKRQYEEDKQNYEKSIQKDIQT